MDGRICRHRSCNALCTEFCQDLYKNKLHCLFAKLNFARSTNRIAVQNVVFALIIKVAVMILGLCGFANMWMAVFADTGVAMLCVLNSVRDFVQKINCTVYLQN